MCAASWVHLETMPEFEVHDRFVGTCLGTVDQDRVGLADRRGAGAEQFLLGLAQLNTDEAERFRRGRAVLQDRRGPGNLLTGERIERVCETPTSVWISVLRVMVFSLVLS